MADLPDVGGIAADQLRQYVERIEKLEEERAELQADVKEVYAEAKANGFAPKVMRRVIQLRKQDADARQEEEHLLDLYKRALGMTD